MGRARSTTIACSACAALFLVAAAARADEPRATLDYTRGTGAERCPDEPGLRDAIARRLGYDPFDPNADVHVHVAVGTEGPALSARVAIDRPDHPEGVRTIVSSAHDCRELADAIVLAVSIAIDPASLTRPSPSHPNEVLPIDGQPANGSAASGATTAGATPTSTATTPPTRPTTATTATDATGATPATTGPASAPHEGRGTARPPPRLHSAPGHVRGTLGVLATLGTAPAVDLGGRLGIELDSHHLRLGFAIRAQLPSGIAVSGGNVTSTLVAGEATACGSTGMTFGCVLVTGGVLAASGEGFRTNASVTAPYLGLGARVGLDLDLGRGFALRLQLDAVLHPVRARLLVDRTAAWTMPVVGATAGALLAIPFS